MHLSCGDAFLLFKINQTTRKRGFMVKRSTPEERGKTEKEILRLWRKLPKYKKEDLIIRGSLFSGTKYEKHYKKDGLAVVYSEEQRKQGVRVDWFPDRKSVIVYTQTHRHGPRH
jgi:hypothetical protein